MARFQILAVFMEGWVFAVLQALLPACHITVRMGNGEIAVCVQQ